MELALSNMVVAHIAEAERISLEWRATLTTALWRSGVAAGVYAWRCSKVAAKLADSIVWMRGARAFMAEQTQVFDPEEVLGTGLRRLAFVQRDLHDRVMELLPTLRSVHIGGTRPALQRALRELAKQSNALLNEVEAFASELVAHDAGYSARDEGWRASTPEEVRELFARL